MKYDNVDIKQNIHQLVENMYGIKIRTMTFIPIGEESYAYKLTANGGDSYFVKFCNRKKSIQNIELVNKVLLRLKHHTFIVPPVVVDGKTSFPCMDGKVYMFLYIDGEVISKSNSSLGKGLLSEIMDIMVKIHLSRDLIDFDIPLENFKNFFGEIFKNIKTLLFEGNSVDTDIQKLFMNNRKLIASTIADHTELGIKCKEFNTEFVLTHGDITGLNMIQTETGIKLVDWDGVMLAPAERDLNFFLDNSNLSVDEYLNRTSRAIYHPEICSYYGQRWSLESILENFRKLIVEEFTDDDKKEYIGEIEEYLRYCR